MSDPNKNPPPPPPSDDFSETVPNIDARPDSAPRGDWDKTKFNLPGETRSDEWGKTVANIKPIETEQDFGKTFYPGQQPPRTPDWGMTQTDVSADDFGGGSSAGFDKTTPYINLPDADRARYQQLPPTPAEQAATEQTQTKGIPGWFWVIGGLLAMFFFAIAVFLIVYFFIIRETGFEATVKGAPPGSSITVDGSPWGVSDETGSVKLPILREGETKRIEIVHPNFTCQPTDVRSIDGVVTPNPIIARCQQVAVKPGEDCVNIRLGEFDKAERCYYKALGDLPDPFTTEQLVRALNILIINFDSGRYEVPAVRLAALQKGAEYIKKLPSDVVLEVGGHTDNVGSDVSNQPLSENRANAVKQTLVKFGVRGEALQIRGYGKNNPRTTNDTEEGRFHNRRIQYSIVRR